MNHILRPDYSAAVDALAPPPVEFVSIREAIERAMERTDLTEFTLNLFREGIMQSFGIPPEVYAGAVAVAHGTS